ncbi:GTP cyclohydrolase II [Streptomyces sp. PSKA54]|uniref:GTP cyclohydrolase-2 n=1 Tax=Streptomyces himalayensis subsp. aureolus TaxID=2758039 RepID=A0A7W2D6I0_9ACTN|nr:GTP cyclohydrolase II [Streptomyces himalayensis]MBA4865632.1 GTP cyclohydrolase II [Streptomyces himalayensis subsp. aureolus]
MAESDWTFDGGQARPSGVERMVNVQLSTVYGDFLAVGYLDRNRGDEQMALIYGVTEGDIGHSDIGDGGIGDGDIGDGGIGDGDIGGGELVQGGPCDGVGGDGMLTRVHSECLTGDAFGSKHCECGEQLSAALHAIASEGRGVLLYLRGHEGRGIGLLGKLRAMKLQQEGLDTVEANLALGFPADARDYEVAADILHDLGVRSVRLLSNNPRKSEALMRHGIKVTEQVPLLTPPRPENITYLRTKRERLDHHLPHLDRGPDRDPELAMDLHGAADWS